MPHVEVAEVHRPKSVGNLVNKQILFLSQCGNAQASLTTLELDHTLSYRDVSQRC